MLFFYNKVFTIITQKSYRVELHGGRVVCGRPYSQFFFLKIFKIWLTQPFNLGSSTHVDIITFQVFLKPLTIHITNIVWTDKPPYVLCNIFGQICSQKYRQFQLHLAARHMRIMHFNHIIILRIPTSHARSNFSKIFFHV